MAVCGLSSTLSFTNWTSSRSSLISSRIGEIRLHGPHHGAQKSTITGLSARKTSLSKEASVPPATAMLTYLRLALSASRPGHSSTKKRAVSRRLSAASKDRKRRDSTAYTHRGWPDEAPHRGPTGLPSTVRLKADRWKPTAGS